MLLRLFSIIASVTILSLSSIGGETSLGVQTEELSTILQVTTADDGRSIIVLDGVNALGIAVGDILTARRLANAPGSIINSDVESYIDTGSIKVTRVEGGVAFAQALKDGTEVSKQVFPKFPGLMAGDLLSRGNVEIVQNVALTPVITLPYHRIFSDPSFNSVTYELNSDGKNLIKNEVSELARLRLSRVVVEGYTDERGSADLSQIESYQRALTVRQFLVNELGFDPDRLLAFGFGESDPIPGPRSPESARLNRRIVIKVLPQAGN